MNTNDNRIRRLAMIGLISAFAAAPALAASSAPNFKTFDSNGDGVISLDEFVALGGQTPTFRAADVNGDNRLDPDEFAKISADKPGPAN
jgi:Ca2+-binding EF-hand superfamily protein